MTTNESLQFFLRLVKQKHDALISASGELLRTLPTDDPNQKKTVATNMLQAGKDLRGILSKSDVPDWLTNTISYLENFVANRYSSFDLLNGFINVKKSIETHRWVFEGGTETAFDFDSIFEYFKNESRLPELFNQILKILEEIEESGEVDSITMLRALGKVIATIKRSKDGSYFSLNSAWEFLLSFLKNYMWGELSKVPVLGAALDALEKTIKETNEEMFKLHQQVQEKMNQTVEAEIKVLKNKSEFQFIAYDRSGHLFETPTSRLLHDAKA